jgi:hypothetical protein
MPDGTDDDDPPLLKQATCTACGQPFTWQRLPALQFYWPPERCEGCRLRRQPKLAHAVIRDKAVVLPDAQLGRLPKP